MGDFSLAGFPHVDPSEIVIWDAHSDIRHISLKCTLILFFGAQSYFPPQKAAV